MSKKPLYNNYIPFIAGSLSGILTKTIVQPFDLVKTRFQVQKSVLYTKTRPQYSSIRQAFREILKNEGVLGLTSGLLPNLFGSASHWACYFGTYHYACNKYMKYKKTTEISPFTEFCFGGLANMIAVLVTAPMWMVKTRIQIAHPPYNGIIDCFRSILKSEGVGALYRGVPPAMLLISNGAIQIMCYDELKKFAKSDFFYKLIPKNKHHSENKLSNSHFLSAGAISKMLATVITYPLQVVRSRLYQKHQNIVLSQETNIFNTFKLIYSREGLKGFYAGLTPQLLKTVPAASLTFLFFENILSFLSKR